MTTKQNLVRRYPFTTAKNKFMDFVTTQSKNSTLKLFRSSDE